MNAKLTILSFAATAILAFDAGIIAEQYRSSGVSCSSPKTINGSERWPLITKKDILGDSHSIIQRGRPPTAAAVNFTTQGLRRPIVTAERNRRNTEAGVNSQCANVSASGRNSPPAANGPIEARQGPINASRLRGQTMVDAAARNSHEVTPSGYNPLRAGPSVHSGSDSASLRYSGLTHIGNPAREAIYQTLNLLWRAESSMGSRMSGDGGLARGHLQFHQGSWNDALIFLGLQDDSSWQWPQATNDLWRCYVVEIAHWQRYCPQALKGGNLELLLRSHRLPCSPYRADNDSYVERVMR